MIEEQISEVTIADQVAVAEVCSDAVSVIRERLQEDEVLNAFAALSTNVIGHTPRSGGLAG
ncbi:hypothetical protein [Bradyrhizobium sp. JR3.5]